MTISRRFVLLAVVLFTLPFPLNLAAQTSAKTESRDYSKEPYVLESIVNKIKFENDGTYIEENQIRVRVQSASGVQDWGLIRLPYASSNGDAEIVDVRVTKANGTIATTPLENIQDMPAQITLSAPFYSDLKEKQLAVRGLDLGDVLEYRVLFHARSPLIPGQFWFNYNFFTQGIVLSDELQISVPRERYVKLKSPKLPPAATDENGYRVYTWRTANLELKADVQKAISQDSSATPFADVQLTSFRSWDEIAEWYRQLQASRIVPTPEIRTKAEELTRGATSENEKIRTLYGYVSTKFRYMGVALGIGRYQPHAAADVLSNGYGDCKDKHTLFAALLAAAGVKAYPALINSSRKIDQDVPSPGQFDHMITVVPQGKDLLWLDTTPEVAPFGFLIASLRDNQALIISDSGPTPLVKTPANPPFNSLFGFQITGKISDDGTLEAKVEASVRGDVELALRTAFRRTPEPQWKDVVQVISRAWNFVGTVSDVTVSSPEAIDTAFSLKYAYTRKDYPNWPDVIRPPLPPLNLAPLPDDADKSSEPIQLESPGEYTVDAKVELPRNLTPRSRAVVDIKKDFAEYHATYSTDSNVLHTERHLIIHMREIPRARSEEYRSFLKAVNDDADSVISLAPSTPPASSEKRASNPGELASAARAEALINLGDTLFYQNDLDGAIGEYNKALQLNPDNARAHRTLADVLSHKNDLDRAIKEYREALRLKSDDPVTHSSLGAALISKNELDGAIAEYKEALRLKPDYAEAHRGLGDASFNKNDFDNAVAAYREALRLKPDDPEVHSSLGDALYDKKDLDGAIAEYKQALRLKPDYAEAHRGLGDALSSKNDLDGAITEYRTALHLKPDDPGAHHNLGTTLFRKDDLDGAITEYREALRLKPDDLQSGYGLSSALLRKGAADQAIDILQKLIVAAPDDPQVYELLAGAYANLHRYDDALKAWKQVEKLSLDNAAAAAGISAILIEMKRFDEAIAELQPAIERNPRSVQFAFLLGRAFARLGEGDKAIASFQKALEINSAPGGLNSVGFELADANVRLDDALRYSEQAVERLEDDTTGIDVSTLKISDLRNMQALAAYWDTLGWVHFRLGHIEEAEKYLTAAWKLAQLPAIGDHLGQVYEKTGDKQKAINFYALTLATNHAPPGTSGRLEALLGNKSRADEAVRAALGDLGQQRTVKVARLAKGKANAEFFVLFGSDGVTTVKFITGSDELRGVTNALASAAYNITFPDDRSAKLVRRGILDCPATGTICQLVLLPPDTVNSLN